MLFGLQLSSEYLSLFHAAIEKRASHAQDSRDGWI